MSTVFTVKATYRGETRKLTFPGLPSFPSFHQIYNQLYRIFPVTNNYYLSKLVFSPDYPSSARIPIAQEVRTAAEYDACIRPYSALAYMNPMLKFSVIDETPHKVPGIVRSELPFVPGIFPAVPHFPPMSAAVIPPPGIIFSNNPIDMSKPMDVDFSAHVPQQQSSENMGPHPRPPTMMFPNNFTGGRPTDAHFMSPQPSPAQHQGCSQLIPDPVKSSCCAASQCKADIESMIHKFKDDLDATLQKGFTPTPSMSSLPSLSPAPTTFCLYQACIRCAKVFQGPWYYCTKCYMTFCTGCFDPTAPPFTSSGCTHDMRRRTCAGCPVEGPPDHNIPPPVKPFSPCMPQPPLPTSAPLPPTPSAAAQQTAATPGNFAIHNGVVCDVCEETIIGARHKCLDCPDYDLCTTCLSSGAAERHCPFHEFFEIKDPGRVVVHTVRSNTTANAPTQEPASHNARCDFCDNQIRGDRYKCLVCPDFDTCEACFTLTGDNHRHAFVRIRNKEDYIRPGLGSTAAQPALIHFATCDLCSSRIRGNRYKCTVCPDYDTCGKCFSIVKEQHPHHGFIRIKDPKDYIRVDTPSRPNHPASCNVCSKSIYGTRYKCMHPTCPDFDLCEVCEALPIAVHPDNHPLLKMKNPNTVVPTVYRVGQTQLIPDIAQSVRPTVPARPPLFDWTQASPVVAPPSPFFYQTLTPRPVSPKPGPVINRISSPPMPIPGSLPSTFTGLGQFGAVSRTPRVQEVHKPWTAPAPWPLPPPIRVSDGSFGPRFGAHSPIDILPPPVEVVRSPSPVPSVGRFPEVPLFTIGHPNPSPQPSTPEWVPRPFENERQPLLSQTESLTTSVESLAPPVLEGPLQLPPLSLGSSGASLNLWSDASKESSVKDEPVAEPVLESHPSLMDLLRETENQLREVTLNLKAESHKAGSQTPEEVQKLPTPEPVIAAHFVEDVTVKDGQVFPPGAEFMKCWRMTNGGTISWPEDTELVWVAGDLLTKGDLEVQPVHIGAIEPGCEAELWTGELKAPDTPGRYVSYWRLRAAGKGLFGDSIWLDIIVAESTVTEVSSEGATSLSSSSVIIMPKVDDKAEIAADAETLSDVSDSSSPSLISVPTESEVDEYVVLYDDATSEED